MRGVTFLTRVRAQVVDQKTRAVCPVGAIGELCTRGYAVMLGYWAQPDKTRESITEDKFMVSKTAWFCAAGCFVCDLVRDTADGRPGHH